MSINFQQVTPSGAPPAGTLKMWNLESERLERVLSGHLDEVGGYKTISCFVIRIRKNSLRFKEFSRVNIFEKIKMSF